MPETLEWRGTTNGNFGTAANWIDQSTGTAAASAPANGDTLIFNKGDVDVDAGLTSGLTGIILVGTSGYTGTIAPGSLLSVACASVRWQSGSTLNLTGNITAGKIRCKTGSSFHYGGGTATTLYIEHTDYLIAAGAVVTTGRARRSNGSDLNNGTGFTLFEISGGSHASRRAGKFIVKDGGTLKAKPECSLSTGTEVVGRSMIEYTSIKTVSGEVIVGPEASFNAAGASSFTWSGTLSYWSGAKINLDTAGGTVTPSTVTKYGLGDEVGGYVPAP